MRPAWSTACLDWQDRIVAGTSLVPCPPLYPAKADEALKVFCALQVTDLPQKHDGSWPTLGDICDQRILDLVAAIFGAEDPETGQRRIREFMLLISKKNGNAYAEIVRNGAGNITALLPVLNPGGVAVRRLSDGDKQYNWTADGVAKVRRQADMLHIRGMGGDGLKGASTLSVCARTFSAATTTDTLARKVFENGVMPSGFLETDKPLSGEQRAVLEKLLQDKFVGAINAGRPMLLDNGLKWQSLSINPEDAQLLESRKFSGEEICRIFGVPPGMVGYGDKASNWGTGKEVDVLGFEKFTLRKRLRRFERALTKQLLTRAERQSGAYIKFNIEGLLRGDSAGRASFYQIMVRLGVLTRNEARRLENLPPIEGGDVPIVQMQDIPLAQAVSGSDGGNGQ